MFSIMYLLLPLYIDNMRGDYTITILKLYTYTFPSCHVFVGMRVKVEQIMQEEVVFRNQVAQRHAT